LVVGDNQRPPLRLAQMIEHDHRHLVQAQLPRRLQARVAGDDHAVGADQDRICPAELHDRRRDLGHLLVCVRARIAREGDQTLNGPTLDLDVEVHFLM
jgi:hypothetical protein